MGTASNSGKAIVYLLRGGAYFRNGELNHAIDLMKLQYQETIHDMSRSIELDSGDLRVFASRGSAYVKARQPEKAVKVLNLTDDEETVQRAKRARKDMGKM